MTDSAHPPIVPPKERTFADFLAAVVRRKSFRLRLPWFATLGALIAISKGWVALVVTLAIVIPLMLGFAYVWFRRTERASRG